MFNEFLFTKIEAEDIGNIWFQQDGAMCHTAKTTLDVLRPIFEDRIISRRADVVWSPRSCELTPLNYYLGGVVKLDTINALKNNIREAIGEISYTQSVMCLQIGPILTGRIILSNKKRNFRKYSVVFF